MSTPTELVDTVIRLVEDRIKLVGFTRPHFAYWWESEVTCMEGQVVLLADGNSAFVLNRGRLSPGEKTLIIKAEGRLFAYAPPMQGGEEVRRPSLLLIELTGKSSIIIKTDFRATPLIFHFTPNPENEEDNTFSLLCPKNSVVTVELLVTEDDEWELERWEGDLEPPDGWRIYRELPPPPIEEEEVDPITGEPATFLLEQIFFNRSTSEFPPAEGWEVHNFNTDRMPPPVLEINDEVVTLPLEPTSELGIELPVSIQYLVQDYHREGDNEDKYVGQGAIIRRTGSNKEWLGLTMSADRHIKLLVKEKEEPEPEPGLFTYRFRGPDIETAFFSSWNIDLTVTDKRPGETFILPDVPEEVRSIAAGPRVTLTLFVCDYYYHQPSASVVATVTVPNASSSVSLSAAVEDYPKIYRLVVAWDPAFLAFLAAGYSLGEYAGVIRYPVEVPGDPGKALSILQMRHDLGFGADGSLNMTYYATLLRFVGWTDWSGGPFLSPGTEIILPEKNQTWFAVWEVETTAMERAEADYHG